MSTSASLAALVLFGLSLGAHAVAQAKGIHSNPRLVTPFSRNSVLGRQMVSQKMQPHRRITDAAPRLGSSRRSLAPRAIEIDFSDPDTQLALAGRN
eukprot:1338274-Amorphochlora_amoeboformis.AAC.1